ncbi:hypothetical protein ACLH17_08475 [Klebsiella pasteurii]|uniref:hypothetical protein n=1 Tax=Klebsiella TaxID=570 RepID=UPI0023F85A34|nr:hypothetical protein [Klebsiella pneumoniae]MDF7736274.1 hypothetical protein [Klebsiella pneumoniae]HDG7815954.1 hypothetical protein [Klebsiella quasipneumoniae]
MLHTAALIAPIIGYCSFSCGMTSYLWCKGKELSKLGWVLAICNVAAFLYLNHILLIDLIQRVADTSDGYISIFDDDFVSDVSRNTIQIMITYIAASTAGGYFGAKKKFKQD